MRITNLQRDLENVETLVRATDQIRQEPRKSYTLFTCHVSSGTFVVSFVLGPNSKYTKMSSSCPPR